MKKFDIYPLPEKTREDRYTKEVVQTLDGSGVILTRRDVRAIRQAFVRHMKEVQAVTAGAIVTRKPRLLTAARLALAALNKLPNTRFLDGPDTYAIAELLGDAIRKASPKQRGKATR